MLMRMARPPATVDPPIGASSPERRDYAPRTVRSVQHAATMLKALRADGRPASLSTLARRVGLSKPAALSLLRTLQAHRLVTRDASLCYRLDWGTYELGSAVSTCEPLVGAARFEVDRLAQLTGQAVLVSILHRGGALYIDAGLAGESFPMTANSGKSGPLHATASGKVLLAFQPLRFLETVLGSALPATTSQTVTDPQELRVQLERVRAQDFATCHQEYELGLSSVAVPVRDPAGRVAAALALAGPSRRFSRAFVERASGQLAEASAKVQAALAEQSGDISMDRTAFAHGY